MTFVNVPKIQRQSNKYLSLLLISFELLLCHIAELRELWQLPTHPSAHQCGIGTRHLHAFTAALCVPRSVLPEDAGRRQMALLQQAERVFFPQTHRAYRRCIHQGCWHVTALTLAGPFLPFALRRRRLSCVHESGRDLMARRIGTTGAKSVCDT